MAIPYLAVAVAYAAGSALPDHLAAICTNLKTIAVVACLILVSHETQECHVYWCVAQLEGLKMKAEVLTEAVKYLEREREISILCMLFFFFPFSILVIRIW